MVGAIHKLEKKGRVLPTGHIDGAYRTVDAIVVWGVLWIVWGCGGHHQVNRNRNLREDVLVDDLFGTSVGIMKHGYVRNSRDSTLTLKLAIGDFH